VGDKEKASESLDAAWQSAGSSFSDAPACTATMPCAAQQPPDKNKALKLLKKECSWVNDTKQFNVKPPAKDMQRLRAKSGTPKKTSSREDPNHTWEDKSTGPAQITTYEIDGKKYDVITPKTAPKGKNVPSDGQVAKALASVPPNQRSKVKDVTVEPTGQTYRGEEVGGDSQNGHVHLYPVAEKQDQGDYDTRMHHETGHAVAESVWTDNPEAYKKWQEAAAKDRPGPSRYANVDDGENFAEFLAMYNAAKGTPCEEAMRYWYPNRYAVMKETLDHLPS
jgi:hypothetical protein